MPLHRIREAAISRPGRAVPNRSNAKRKRGSPYARMPEYRKRQDTSTIKAPRLVLAPKESGACFHIRHRLPPRHASAQGSLPQAAPLELAPSGKQASFAQQCRRRLSRHHFPCAPFPSPQVKHPALDAPSMQPACFHNGEPQARPGVTRGTGTLTPGPHPRTSMRLQSDSRAPASSAPVAPTSHSPLLEASHYPTTPRKHLPSHASTHRAGSPCAQASPCPAPPRVPSFANKLTCGCSQSTAFANKGRAM